MEGTEVASWPPTAEIPCAWFPPGDLVKWNKVEHRLFSFITMNWRARPLVSHQVVIETVAATTTKAGLTVRAMLDTSTYEKGIKISDKEMRAWGARRLHATTSTATERHGDGRSRDRHRHDHDTPGDARG